jgi:hypothetical protein
LNTAPVIAETWDLKGCMLKVKLIWRKLQGAETKEERKIPY